MTSTIARTRRPTWLRLGAALLTATTAVACGGGGGYGNDPPDAAPATTPDAPVAPVKVLKRASKSGTIAITGDDKTVAMVNPENGSITTFDAETQTVKATLATGAEPAALVIHPDDDTLFVVNRADATVVKITGLGGATPAIVATLPVGSEPAGLALSPTGATLYVTEFAESRVAVIDTATMTIVDTIAVDRPRAIAVTNNGDDSDADESIVVPAFYGEPVGTEATDTSRQGRVHVFASSDRHELASITLGTIDSGFAPSTAAAGAATVTASPNQLWAAGIVGTRVFIPSVAASPAAPVDFQANVQPVAYVVDLATGAEDRGPRGTANLAKLVHDQVPDTGPRFFLADLVDVAFVGDKVAYYASRGGDAIQKVVYDDAGPTLGLPFNFQIDLNVTPTGSTKPCQNPTGIVTAHVGGRAYVNCWVTRQLGVIDLGKQALVTTIASAPISTDEADANDGRRFYFTGRGRWSKNAWSSCGSCHPDGLSDNITWVFGSGPRQTTSMDGTFSHHAGTAGKQRALNWTAINDEIHDFERNTRGTSGGLGAVTTPGAGGCKDLTTEVRVNIDPDTAHPGAMSVPVTSIINATAGVCTHDWDKIEAFVKTIRPPRASRFLDAASVARGAALFGEPTATANNAGCVKCHGGAGWTVSRRFYGVTDPQIVADLHAQPFAPPGSFGLTWSQAGFQIQTEPTAPTARAPEQLACVLRNLGTFGPAGLEQRLVAGALVPAQGSLGYNVPSLYGLALGAPYLHHGLAKDLVELFDDPTWQAHTTAGNPVWLESGTAGEIAQRKQDLINFLRSIDASTAEQTTPSGFDGCPST
ncbi:MAG: hypothetical protein K8W52_41210 [Deltaproteobacteria bacterium]|nr:hypothetical protein [Deltaproteobacteria bacterium]